MGKIRTGITERSIAGGGKRLYAIGLHTSNVGNEELIAYMLNNAQVGAAAAQAAVEGLAAVVKTFVVNGHSVVVPYFGTLSLTCNSKTSLITKTPPAQVVTDAEKKQMSEFRQQVANAVQNIRVRFTPSTSVRRAARSTTFEGVIVQED